MSDGVSPRRKFNGQLIDIAAAAMERRSSCASSRGSPAYNPLPSPLQIEHRSEPNVGRAEGESDSQAEDSPSDANVPVIFASVHHDPSEMEALRQQMEQDQELKRRGRETRA
jgi:hypothetical protein